MRFSRSSAAAVAISLPLAIAQTSTSCNPLEKTCPQDTGLNSASFTSNFMDGKSALASWSSAGGTTLNFGSNGAEFSISADGQAPTISTDFYVFFGKIDVKMRASPGAGIVSSIVLLSDDLDEIDWEFLGGNTAQVETNFFGKGNTTSYNRATYEQVSSPQTETHTYTVDWNSDRIEWIIDGEVVRTLQSTDSEALGGKNYPQTPCRLKLGSWCGGCKGEAKGTVEWAGGPTTFDGAPYNMYVESVAIQNSNPGSSYEWMGNSGSWQSIKVMKNGGSVVSPSGSATLSGNLTHQTNAPTKSISVGHIMNTGAVVSSTIKGGNHSTKGGPGQGHGASSGGVQTHTMFTTTNLPSNASPTANGAAASGSAGASSSSSPGMASSATSLALWTTSSLLGLLCGFLLL